MPSNESRQPVIISLNSDLQIRLANIAKAQHLLKYSDAIIWLLNYHRITNDDIGEIDTEPIQD